MATAEPPPVQCLSSCPLLNTRRTICQDNPCVSIGLECLDFGAPSTTRDCLDWCCETDRGLVAVVVIVIVILVFVCIAIVALIVFRCVLHKRKVDTREVKKERRRRRETSLLTGEGQDPATQPDLPARPPGANLNAPGAQAPKRPRRDDASETTSLQAGVVSAPMRPRKPDTRNAPVPLPGAITPPMSSLATDLESREMEDELSRMQYAAEEDTFTGAGESAYDTQDGPSRGTSQYYGTSAPPESEAPTGYFNTQYDPSQSQAPTSRYYDGTQYDAAQSQAAPSRFEGDTQYEGQSQAPTDAPQGQAGDDGWAPSAQMSTSGYQYDDGDFMLDDW